MLRPYRFRHLKFSSHPVVVLSESLVTQILGARDLVFLPCSPNRCCTAPDTSCPLPPPLFFFMLGILCVTVQYPILQCAAQLMGNPAFTQLEVNEDDMFKYRLEMPN